MYFLQKIPLSVSKSDVAGQDKKLNASLDDMKIAWRYDQLPSIDVSCIFRIVIVQRAVFSQTLSFPF